MSCVNPNDSLFKILLKELKNPLLAEIEFDTQQDYKPGVSELFDSIPELESIGTEEQYSQYIDSIFPDSKVKDIVYHGTPEGEFENFDISKSGKVTGNSTKGIYFSDSKKTADFYAEGSIDFSQFESLEEYEAVKKAKTFSAILNAKNLKLVDNPQAQEKQGDAILRTKEKLSDKGFIGEIDYAHQFIVFDPQQIYILGNKQDIEGFKKFVGKTAIKEPVEVDEEINSYISNELFKKFGVMVPTVDNENLIDEGAVASFNNTVAMNNGILPAQYYNGVNNTHKWILNKKQLYDLVDKDTSEVYLKDVNLTTGVHEEKLTYSPINEEERDATINSLNDAVKDYRIDEILAEKGYDVNDIISNLEAATTQEELDKIINKLLRMIC